MKRISVIIAAALLVFSACSESQSGKGYSIVDDTIVFDTPERAEGQESVLGLRTDPLETVRVGFIGLGMRGLDAVKRPSSRKTRTRMSFPTMRISAVTEAWTSSWITVSYTV